MKPGSRVVLALLACNVSLFAFFFALALFGYSATDIIPRLALRWELAEAGLGFLAWYAPLQFIAAILAVSTLKGEVEGIVAGTAVPAIAISALVAAAALVGGPLLAREKQACEILSGRFTTSLEGFRRAVAAGDFAEAKVLHSLLTAIDPKDPRLVEPEKRLSALSIKDSRAKAERDVEAARDPAGAKAAWRRANEFFAKGDWYNAHWQATLAGRLDPALLVESTRLAGKAWEAMMDATGDTDLDLAGKAFFARKLEGYGLLRSEDFIGAFRIFDELAKSGHDKDAEVRRYLKESLAGVERTTFWRDEAIDASTEASLPRLFLRFSGDKPGTETILAARECAFTSGAAYLADLEYLEVRADDSARLLRARWAKVATGRLFLISADREDPGSVERPEALEIPAGAGIDRGRTAKAPASLDFRLSAGDLWNLAAAATVPASLPAFDALTTLARARDYGIPPVPLLDDLQRRSGVPFEAFGSTMLGVLVGLRFRRPKDDRRGPSLLALPFVALLTLLAFQGIARLDLLAATWCSRLFADTRALALSAGLRALFIAALIVLAVGATRADPDHAASPTRAE